MNLLIAATVAAMFGAGAHLLVRPDGFKLAAGTVLLTNAAVLLLVSAGFGTRRAPIGEIADPTTVADPLVQALALTAVVISFGTTVLLLRLAMAVEQSHDSIALEDLAAAETEEAAQDDGQRKPEKEHREAAE
ncbi:MAG TPA: sodium:proton antiporter [Polyangiaceae bacterium LLY-WYZ-14_1]|nr:sodium:proton antiporter [Polyangiaceae bacterium LLY-WYZ-14_1]